MSAIKFSKQYIEPNPQEIDYWVDLSTNPYGGILKYHNGTNWVELINPDGTTINVDAFYTKLQINQMLSGKASAESVESKVGDKEIADVINNITFEDKNGSGINMVIFKYGNTSVGIDMPIASNTSAGIVTKDSFKDFVKQNQLQNLYTEMYDKFSDVHLKYQKKLKAGKNILIDKNNTIHAISNVSDVSLEWDSIHGKPDFDKLFDDAALAIQAESTRALNVEQQLSARITNHIDIAEDKLDLKADKKDVYTKDQVDEKIVSVYKIKGSSVFESLPVENNVIGDVYNITNNFTLNGVEYPFGTNIVWTENGWDTLSGIFDSTELENIVEETNTKVDEESVRAKAKELELDEKKADKDSVYSIEEIDSMLSVSKYEFVDLGLPSGLKWAAWNVGATKPEEFGLYFAWGETQGYSGITDEKQFTLKDYKLSDSTGRLTKYNNNSAYGTVDNLSTLELVDDAAYVSDNTCRMPTEADLRELTANTISTWETLNGVKGKRFTSKINNNSIFVPAAGYCYDSSVKDVGYSCHLWGSLCDEYDPYYSWYLYVNSGVASTDGGNRTEGLSVRAVQEANISSKFDPSEVYGRLDDLESNKANKTEIPTKVSQLENDANYIQDDVVSNGVYAVDANGKLIDYHTADASCIGVAFISDNQKVMIPKNDATNDGSNYNLYWGVNFDGHDVPNLENISDISVEVDFNGKTNTAAIIAEYTELGVDMNSHDMCKALETYNENGYTDWYVPAAGQLLEIYANRPAIEEALTAINGTKFSTNRRYWSSSENSSSNAWYVVFSSGQALIFPKSQQNRVRFVRDISVPTLKERVTELEAQIGDINTILESIING